jgi:hypothetical protein
MSEALRQNKSFTIDNPKIITEDSLSNKPLYGNSFTNYLVNLRSKKRS